MKSSELYKEARQLEINEFLEIADKVRKYMGEWANIDEDGCYGTGNTPCVCACTSYDHPSDYDIVKVFWNDHDVLRLVGIECESGCEVEFSCEDLEYGHLCEVTTHLEDVLSDFLIKRIITLAEGKGLKEFPFRNRVTTCIRNYAFEQTTEFSSDTVIVSKTGLTITSLPLTHRPIPESYDICDVPLDQAITLLEQMYEQLSL